MTGSTPVTEPGADSRRYRAAAAAGPGSILLETTRALPGLASRSFFFEKPVEWIEVHALAELPELFARLEAARAAGLWAAGYLGYECGYHWEPTAARDFAPRHEGLPLAAFGVYRAPIEFTSGAAVSGVTVADATDSGATVSSTGAAVANARLGITPEAFAGKISRVHGWIERGDTYQVNLTDRILGSFADDPADLFTHMMAAQPVPFGALLRVGDRHILSASPELFFSLHAQKITVRPMKGTSRAGRDARENEALARALAGDPKNRAENIMIVDLLRSDLGRVAETGSVRVERLFEVEQFPTLLQMSSEITALLRPGIDMYTLFGSLFPSGSIVGAPKVLTMQILRELEGRERGVYTGAIGYIAPDGDAVFSVAIRTAVLQGGQVEMGVGAGVTWDSEAAAEYAEVALKGEFLRGSQMGLAAAPSASSDAAGLPHSANVADLALGADRVGLIETMRWDRGVCALLDRHLDRLERSAGALVIPFDRRAIRRALEEEAAKLSSASAWRMRLVLERDGSLTLSPPQALPTVERPESGLRVMLWPDPVRSTDPLLRHKTTARDLYDEALRTAQAAGCVDALFHNEHGMVTEGAIHNIFIRHGRVWRTPPLEAGVLPGVYREHLLASAPAMLPGVIEADIRLEELWTAEEILLTNAVRGMRRVVLADSSG